MICKDCKIEVTRTVFIAPTGYKRHKDSNGRYWNGRQCPDCSSKEKNISGPIKNLSHRKCRKCNSLLGLDRYYYHEECAPQIECSNEYDDFTYHW